MRMPREALTRPASGPLPPAAVDRPSAAVAPVAAAAVSSGGERHATRRLEVHAMPAEGARILAVIDTGTSVKVMRTDGRWRYVRSTASRAEGWVDGSFLAGESAPARSSGFTPIGYRTLEPPPVPGLIITTPVPR